MNQKRNRLGHVFQDSKVKLHPLSGRHSSFHAWNAGVGQKSDVILSSESVVGSGGRFYCGSERASP